MSVLLVHEAAAGGLSGGGGAGPAAEFPGNILEGRGEGRLPGRGIGPADATEDSQPHGNTD